MDIIVFQVNNKLGFEQFEFASLLDHGSGKQREMKYTRSHNNAKFKKEKGNSINVPPKGMKEIQVKTWLKTLTSTWTG